MISNIVAGLAIFGHLVMADPGADTQDGGSCSSLRITTVKTMMTTWTTVMTELPPQTSEGPYTLISEVCKPITSSNDENEVVPTGTSIDTSMTFISATSAADADATSDSMDNPVSSVMPTPVPDSPATAVSASVLGTSSTTVTHLGSRDLQDDYPDYPKKNMLYVTSWGNITEHDIPAEKITHLIYAFAGIAKNNSIYIEDKGYDSQRPQDKPIGWTWGGEKMYKLKKKHPHLKTMISVGGVDESDNLRRAVQTPETRRVLVKSIRSYIMKWGLDGAEIHWQYPKSRTEGKNLLELLREYRHQLGEGYLLAAAVSANPGRFEGILKVAEMDPLLNTWHLMAWDYSGLNSQKTAYHSNFFQYNTTSADVAIDTRTAINAYVKHEASSKKIIMGIPLYGHSFAHTKKKGVGHDFNGTGEGATAWGTRPFKDLPLENTTEEVDDTAISAYCYDKKTKEFVVYDNRFTAEVKSTLVTVYRLGGAVFWDASQDKADNGSLVKAVAEKFLSLDITQNRIDNAKCIYS